MSDEEEFHAALYDDLHTFIIWAFRVLNPGDEFKDNWHVAALAHHLMKAYRGDIRRLLITMPPRSLKSLSVTIAFVAWVLGRHPEMKFLCASYGEKPANDMADLTRTLMRHPDYVRAFPDTQFSDHSPLDFLKTTKQGHRIATSVGGPATSFGCDFLIVDDINKADATEGERERAIGFYRSSLITRLNQKADGRAIVVGQRIAADDLPGDLLDRGGWTVLELSAIAQEDQKIEIGPGKFYLRKKGDVLHPEREGKKVLDEICQEIGGAAFAAQYLQRPNASLGAMLLPDWFPTYAEAKPRHRYEHVSITIDAAMSTSPTADYSACAVFGTSGGLHDLLEVWRDRVDLDELAVKIKGLINKWKATHVFIEMAVAGYSLQQNLAAIYGEGGICRVYHRKNKEDRLGILAHVFQKRLIRFPVDAPWLASLKNELYSFPSVKHDDQTDVLMTFAAHAQQLEVYPIIEWTSWGPHGRLVEYA